MVSGRNRAQATAVPRRGSRSAGSADAPRRRCACGAVLASDNRDRLCSNCKESGRGRGDDQAILDFALELYPHRQTLGVLGLDYMFFHRFFNDELQDELTRLRQRLYHQPEPPRPLSLGNAAAWAGRTETSDVQRETSSRAISDLIKETSLPRGTSSLLLHAFDEPAWAKSLRQHAAAVSERLRELEDDLPAAIGTLHLALVCGTPPLPPGIRARSGPSFFAQVGFAQAFCLKVFSAKERDIRTVYEAMLGGDVKQIKGGFFPLASQWQKRGLLPFLQVICVPYRGRVPTAAAFQRFFREARRPVSRFFDGAVKAREYGHALRAWTIRVLIDQRKMSHRDALGFWNDRAPPGLSLRFSAAVAKTQTGESTLSQQLGNLRRRIARWQSA